MLAKNVLSTNNVRNDAAYEEDAVSLSATEDEGCLLLDSREHRLVVLQKFFFKPAAACRRRIKTAY